MGYIRENKNGKSFRIAVSIKDPITGKFQHHFETVKTDSKRIAEKRLRDLQQEIDKGNFVKPSKLTVRDYLESWLQGIAGPNKTYQGYEYNVRKYIIPALGALPLTALKSEHIKKLIAEQKAKEHFRTAQYIYSTLSKSLNDALKDNLIVRNPVDGMDKPKVRRHEFKTLSENDLNKFLEAIKDSEYYPLFFTDLFSGMRRSESLAIRWKDVDLLAMTVSVNRTLQQLKGGELVYLPPKTAKSRRLIALTPANCVVLREHKEKQERLRKSLNLPALSDENLVFSRYDGKAYLPDSITHTWGDLIKVTGFSGIRLHDARHSHATILLNKGVHPKIVQERLGHATISTTLDIYSHVAPGMQAAAALKFDDVLQAPKSKLEKDVNELFQK